MTKTEQVAEAARALDGAAPGWWEKVGTHTAKMGYSDCPLVRCELLTDSIYPAPPIVRELLRMGGFWRYLERVNCESEWQTAWASEAQKRATQPVA